MSRIFKTAVTLLAGTVMTLQAATYDEAAFKKELFDACKSRSGGYVHLDGQRTHVSMKTAATEDPIIFVGIFNALVFISTVGIVPMCTTRDATVSTNIGSTVYDFTQFACIGWLAWSQDMEFDDICEDFVDARYDQVRYDLYDQGYIEKR